MICEDVVHKLHHVFGVDPLSNKNEMHLLIKVVNNGPSSIITSSRTRKLEHKIHSYALPRFIKKLRKTTTNLGPYVYHA